MVSLFIPTTPNPTSGFLMMAAKKMSLNEYDVDQALKFLFVRGGSTKHKNTKETIK